jgi:hypothetical protein
MALVVAEVSRSIYRGTATAANNPKIIITLINSSKVNPCLPEKILSICEISL